MLNHLITNVCLVLQTEFHDRSPVGHARKWATHASWLVDFVELILNTSGMPPALVRNILRVIVQQQHPQGLTRMLAHDSTSSWSNSSPADTRLHWSPKLPSPCASLSPRETITFESKIGKVARFVPAYHVKRVRVSRAARAPAGVSNVRWGNFVLAHT